MREEQLLRNKSISEAISKAIYSLLGFENKYFNKEIYPYNSVIYYEINLPTAWSCEHPLGSVTGRAQYG